MPTKLGNDLVLSGGYDYSVLDRQVATQVRSSAEKIRGNVKKTLEAVIDIGNDLLAVKEALPHGQFGPWVRSEFGWAERTVRNFLAVAELFGPKTAIIADLAIQPTAAYLLAAPSVPEEARICAIERAEAGEKVTAKVARELVARVRKRERRRDTGGVQRMCMRLRKTLEGCRARWSPADCSTFARSLREFADDLDGTRKKEKQTGKK